MPLAAAPHRGALVSAGPRMLRCLAIGVAVLAAALGCLAAVAKADPVKGAIFTTDSTGLEVNVNQYASKPDVYLNGGPGVNAPIGAAGLVPDGTYVFQVTDPSGKTLLSQDAAQCREFTVSGGVITGVTGPCPHATGLSLAPGEVTVQLCTPPDPGSCYNDTPNNGGVYKVWVTPLLDYQCDVTVVDCGVTTGSGGFKHGFIPSDSKTDNFKVGPSVPQEIDTRFFDSSGNVIDGLGITWTDPLGGTNNKWSYYAPSLDVNHEAHVEAVAQGVNLITVADQPGCTVGDVYVLGSYYGFGPQTVPIKITGTTKTFTDRVDVYCL